MVSPHDNDRLPPIDDDEIRSFQVTRWKTINSVFHGNLQSLIQNKEFSQYFSDDYIKNLGDRWRELHRLLSKLSILLFSLLMFIGAIESGVVLSITIFGIKISNENSTLSILILISSVLMFYTSILSLLSDHYRAVIKSFTGEKMNEEAEKYYALQHVWDLRAYFDGLQSRDENLTGNLIIVVMIVFLVSTILLSAAIISTLGLYIFLSSIVFIYENPKLPAFMNVPIVVIAICAAAFNITNFLLKLPLPYSDSSNLKKLNELEESNPVRSKEMLTNIAKYSLKKERRNVITLQMVIMLTSLLLLYFLATGMEFFSNYAMFFNLIVVSFAFLYFISPLLDKYERVAISKSMINGDNNTQVSIYTKRKRIILRTRLLLSLAFGVLSFCFFQSDIVWEILQTMWNKY